MSVEIESRTLLLQNAEDLTSLVQGECSNLGISLTPAVKEDQITSKEKVLIEKVSFPDELKFSVQVNLASSKKAYLNLLSDLNESDSFEDLWSFNQLDPSNYQHPMSSMDVSFFMSQPSPPPDEKRQQETKRGK